MHKHNHPASSEESLWEGQEYEKESTAINKLEVLLEEAVFTAHRGPLALGRHNLASPSLDVTGNFFFFPVKPFGFFTL